MSKVIKVSDGVYEKLQELSSKMNESMSKVATVVFEAGFRVVEDELRGKIGKSKPVIVCVIPAVRNNADGSSKLKEDKDRNPLREKLFGD